MAVSSLPSPYGIGTLGKAAYDFVDFLKAASQSYWQMLPLNPTSYGDSPYQSFSAYAGNPYFIDPDMLVKDGLLKRSECTKCDWGNDPRHVDYGKIYESRFALLHKAYKRGWERDADKVAAFVEDNSRWLPDYALYMACKRHFGMKAWTEWEDEDIRLRKSEAVLEKYRALLADDVQFFTYLQFLFFSQWELLRDYVHQQGIRINGDLPIYVSMASAAVWSEPLYDVIRIDHFRGFASYWSVPYGETTAKNGHWVTGPGMDLIDRLNGWFPQLEFIAEDLGYPTPEVAQLLHDSGWPGMKVLEFAFDSRDTSSYLPHTYTPHCICYTGTHDNSPLLLWRQEAAPEDIAYAAEYLALTEDEGFHWGVIRGGMSSVAELFVAQMQDYLGLGEGHRMNIPGTQGGNWTWRLLPGELTEKLAARIAGLPAL